MNNYQIASRGKDTTFEHLIADGGGAVIDNIFNYNIASNITINSNYTITLPSRPNELIQKTFTSNFIIYNSYTSNIPLNIIGGSGSGNNASPSIFKLTNNLKTFLGNTSNIYSYGYKGGNYGGGGAGRAGDELNGGNGLSGLDIYNLNIDMGKYYNYNRFINFKRDFNIIEEEDNIGELNGGQVYFACGGAGSNIITEEKGISQLGYSINSGSGGNYGENGKNGALLLRYLTKIDKKVIPFYVLQAYNYTDTLNNITSNYTVLSIKEISNYIELSSNNLINKANINENNVNMNDNNNYNNKSIVKNYNNINKLSEFNINDTN
jgi:hypothetical protein